MAYLAYVSASEKIDSLMQSSPSLFLLNPDLQSIPQQIESSRDWMFNYTPYVSVKMEYDGDVEEEMQDLVKKFEDLIESHLQVSSDDSDSVFVADLIKATQDIVSFAQRYDQQCRQWVKMYLQKHNKPGGDIVSVADARMDLESSKLVGLDGEVAHLLDLVMKAKLDSPAGNVSIAIHGMPGIGKTTLVQLLFDHPLVKSHFDTRLWITIGTDIWPRKAVLLLLGQLGFDLVSMNKDISNEELKDKLRHFFQEEKMVLVVLDDVWHSETVEYLVKLFPCERFVFIITSRTDLGYDATRINSNWSPSYVHKKWFLDDEDSWNLLRVTVFDSLEEPCSHQLEKIGRKIAANCEGLPLAIIGVGELLKKAEKTVEYWTKVSQDDNPLGIGIDVDSHISKTLVLSYKMLTYVQKVFFLYVGLFPREYEIFSSELFILWLVEGFFPPSMCGGNLVQTNAWRILNHLIAQSVVLGVQLSTSSHYDDKDKQKTCKVHTVFRNLCISAGQKEKFSYVIKKYTYSFPKDTNRQKRLCIHNNVTLSIKPVHDTMGSLSSVLSLLCLGPYHRHPLRIFFNFKFLRTFHALRIYFYEFPDEVLNLSRLRYLSITYNGELPKSISKLQILEVLIVGRHQIIKSSKGPSYLPMEIWDLKHLIHLECMGADMPEPCSSTDGCLEDLLTLSGVSIRSCKKSILERMPKLEKLGIHIELAHDVKRFEDFSCLAEPFSSLQCLKSFSCVVLGLNSHVVSAIPMFPSHLKKLSLSGCGFTWNDIGPISELHELRVLKLRWCSFRGPRWESCKSAFGDIRFLLLEDLDIEEWIADDDSFFHIKHLVIRHCYKLRDIPLRILKNLKCGQLEVEDCSAPVMNSAKELEKRQEISTLIIKNSWDGSQET